MDTFSYISPRLVAGQGIGSPAAFAASDKAGDRSVLFCFAGSQFLTANLRLNHYTSVIFSSNKMLRHFLIFRIALNKAAYTFSQMNKKKPGRPKVLQGMHRIAARLDDETFDALWRLKALWRCSDGEVVRRCIQETDKKYRA